MSKRKSNVRRVLDANAKLSKTRARGNSDRKLSPKMRDQVDESFGELVRGRQPSRKRQAAIDAEDARAVPRRWERELEAASATARAISGRPDQAFAAVEYIARLRSALEPFAALAEGKDGWRGDSGCAVFPAMTLVRAARDVLASGPATQSPRIGVFRSPMLELKPGDHALGDRLCGVHFDRVEIHATAGDVRAPAFWKWVDEDVRCRLADIAAAIDAVAVYVYPGEPCKWRIMHAHTDDEVRVRVAISNMPGGGSRSELHRAGSDVGFVGARMAPVTAASVATYLETLSDIRREELDDLMATRKKLAAVESDLAAVARVFGGAKTAADREVPE